MSTSLSVADWMTLGQLIYHINCIEDLQIFPRQVLSLLDVILDSSTAVFCLAEQNNGIITMKDMYSSVDQKDKLQDLKAQLTACPYITSLCLDSSGPVSRGPILAHFDKATSTVKEVVPKSLGHALSMVLYHKESFLGYIIFWRKPEMESFNSRDKCIFSTIRNHIALQLYKVIHASLKPTDEKYELEGYLQEYNLSKREIEVLYHICEGQNDAQICDMLFVSSSTFKKHLNHIYKKMHVNSRLKLMKLVGTEKSRYI